MCRPYQIRRIAEAEADASIISAQANIQITDLQRRAAQRFLAEEAQKQQNIEDITQKALPNIANDAKPENMENDWITNFFDKGRLVSDQEMQEIWSKILAGEANKPGCCSKRTVNLLSSMDKREAELFKKLCTFVWDIFGLIPLIYDCQASIYNDAGINFNTLQHLELAGLIKFGNIGEFKIQKLKQEVIAAYYRQPYRIKFLLPEDNDFAIGSVILTEPGKQLALVCGSTPNSAFRDYILDRWKGLDVSPA